MENVLSEKQKLFLRYAFIERKRYDEVAALLQLPRNEFKGWWNELKEERERLKPMRDLCIKKCGDLFYDEFEAIYLNTKLHFHCYGIFLSSFWLSPKEPKGQDASKASPRRPAAWLAAASFLPALDTSICACCQAMLEIFVFSCYSCTYTNTDTFIEEEFMQDGEVIGEVWRRSWEKHKSIRIILTATDSDIIKITLLVYFRPWII